MTEANGQVTGSAAEIYDQFFVPALFAEWAPRVADAAALAPGATAVDVACGTGVLARELAARVGAANVSGLDCNPGMLAVARARAPGIEWRQGRAEELPFESDQVDAATSQFGLMFFEDRVRALTEMWRVVRPGGRLVVAVWGALADTPGYAAMTALLRRLFGDDIADELRAPFCLGDVQALRALFTAAGLDDVDIHTHVGTARFPSIRDWVHTDVRGWTLADRITDEQYETLSREAPSALQQFVVDGQVVFDSPAHIAVAHKR